MNRKTEEKVSSNAIVAIIIVIVAIAVILLILTSFKDMTIDSAFQKLSEIFKMLWTGR